MVSYGMYHGCCRRLVVTRALVTSCPAGLSSLFTVGCRLHDAVFVRLGGSTIVALGISGHQTYR